jgi:hypothetical protein
METMKKCKKIQRYSRSVLWELDECTKYEFVLLCTGEALKTSNMEG